MFNKQNILKNITEPEEKLFFAKAFDQALLCIRNFTPAYTDFADPFKVFNFIKCCGLGRELNIKAFGGNENCERLMLAFSPDYINIEDSDFPISILNITYNSNYSRKLTHRDFLGSVLGLGITREKVGDIIVQEDSAFVFVQNEIADYICINLEKVGNTKVNVTIADSDKVIVTNNIAEDKNVTVSSLRLDTILSAAFNLSRGKASAYISSDKVFVNWIVADSTSKILSEGDIITLRGMGRIKFNSVLGKTKKEKYLINIIKY